MSLLLSSTGCFVFKFLFFLSLLSALSSYLLQRASSSCLLLRVSSSCLSPRATSSRPVLHVLLLSHYVCLLLATLATCYYCHFRFSFMSPFTCFSVSVVTYLTRVSLRTVLLSAILPLSPKHVSLIMQNISFVIYHVHLQSRVSLFIYLVHLQSRVSFVIYHVHLHHPRISLVIYRVHLHVFILSSFTCISVINDIAHDNQGLNLQLSCVHMNTF